MGVFECADTCSVAVGRAWKVQLLAGKHAGVVEQWSAAAACEGSRLRISGEDANA